MSGDHKSNNKKPHKNQNCHRPGESKGTSNTWNENPLWNWIVAMRKWFKKPLESR